jgi:hypothetical protein
MIIIGGALLVIVAQAFLLTDHILAGLCVNIWLVVSAGIYYLDGLSAISSGKSWKDYSGFLVAILLAMAGLTWFTTHGTWTLFATEGWGAFFDGQALSLLHGRLDVPSGYLCNEVFLNHGTTYMYFGMFPAILRIPVLLLVPSLAWHDSRLFLLIGQFLGLLMLTGILLELRKRFTTAPLSLLEKIILPFFLLTLVFGTTFVFVTTLAWVYYEAIVWGANCALAAIYFSLVYLRTGRVGALVGILLGAAACLMSRPSTGAGMLLALGILWLFFFTRLPWVQRLWPWSKMRPGYQHPSPQDLPRHLFIWAVGLGLTLSIYWGVNYLKFDTIDGAPIEKHATFLSNPNYLKQIQGKMMHLKNVPALTATYLWPTPVEFLPSFPWMKINAGLKDPWNTYPIVNMNDCIIGMPAGMPGVLFLAVLGILYWLVRRPRILPLGGFMLGGLLVFVLITSMVGVVLRYTHDVFFILALLSSLGFMACLHVKNRLAKAGLVGLPVKLRDGHVFAVQPGIFFAIFYDVSLTRRVATCLVRAIRGLPGI